MFSCRSNPIAAIVALAGLLSAQFANGSHAHMDETSELAGRPHVHTGHAHSHSHPHGHAHMHSHGLHKHAAADCKAHPTTKAKRTVAARSGFARATSEHDRDAVYVSADLLCITTQPSVIKSTSSQLLFSPYLVVQLPADQPLAWYRLHPPDPAPPRALYRLNQAILC